VRSEANRTLAILSSKQKDIIKGMLFRWEGGNYDTVSLFNGRISFGLLGWDIFDKTGLDILSKYVDDPQALHSEALRAYMRRIQDKDRAFSGGSELHVRTEASCIG
jgi:hypothetical protein